MKLQQLEQQHQVQLQEQQQQQQQEQLQQQLLQQQEQLRTICPASGPSTPMSGQESSKSMQLQKNG
jgi:hypothetical protein